MEWTFHCKDGTELLLLPKLMEMALKKKKKKTESFCYLWLYLVLLSLLTPSAFGSNVVCPYNFSHSDTFANLCAEQGSHNSAQVVICCEEIYGAALFSAAQYTNATGRMFLTEEEATQCIEAYERRLVAVQHLSHAFFQSYCPLPASRITVHSSACNFDSIRDLLRTIDLVNTTEACYSHRSGQQNSCQACQSQLLSAISKLTHLMSDRLGTCGTAIAIAMTSFYPSYEYFTVFYQCVLQILNGEPLTEFLNISTTPIAGKIKHSGSSHVSSRTLFIVFGIIAGLALASLCIIISIYVYRTRYSNFDFPSAFSVSGGLLSSESSGRTVLPTEGFYIFHLKELTRATNNFSGALIVGEGSAGTVYVGQLPSGKLVAVKRILKEKKIETFYKEVELLARIRHPNLTALLGYCQSKFVHLLVYEYMINGNLSQKLLDRSSPALTWNQRIQIAIDCAKGLTYLHEYPDGPIIHRDIKPTNILLNESFEAKVSDFGLSKILETEASHISTEIKGTTGYLDPEYLILGQLTEASDVYSFGVVLLQLISGRKAIDNDLRHHRSIIQMATSVMNHEILFEEIVDARLEGGYSRVACQKLLEIAFRCIQSRSYDRPSISEVLDGLGLVKRLCKSHPI